MIPFDGDMNGKGLLCRVTLAAACAAMLVGAGACDAGGHRTYTLTRGIGHFSFEYPARYRIGKVEIKEEYTDVSLHEYRGEDRVATYLDVFITSYAPNYPDAKAHVEQDLANYQTAGTFPDLDDFRLIARSSMVVADIPAEQIRYFYNAPPTIFEANRGLGPKPIVTREVYFATGTSLWELRLSYQQTDAASDAFYDTDFDRLLKTFKIIE